MTSLFFETFIIQLFVGMLFLMLGIWAGRYLFAGIDAGSQEAPESVNAAHGGSASIEKTLDESEKAISSLKDESRQLRTLNERLEQELRVLREKIDEPKADEETAAEPSKPKSKAKSKTAKSKSKAKKDSAGDEADSVKEEPKAEKKDEEPSGDEAAKQEPDDLLKIRGIGKVMAEKLEKKGVVTYKQIADWTKEDIAKFSFKSRIGRDKWQTQARRLHKQKYGG